MQPKSQYLVISRGQWDKDAAPEQIQKAIDEFYRWVLRLVDEGKMKTGQRLGIEGKSVREKASRMVLLAKPRKSSGGYWFF
jgi:hypothetical protein